MDKKILVFGGTGFLGESIVNHLIDKEFRPTLFVRDISKVDRELSKKVDILKGDLKNINKYKSDILQLNPDVVIYCVGLIRETYKNRFLDFHYKWPLEILRNLESLNSKFIYVSANGTENNAVPYQKTKLMFENKLRLMSENYIVLKPSIVWGKSDKYNFKNELERLTKYRLTPIIGDGQFIFSPVLRSDISKIVINIIERDIRNKEYSICGPRKYHFIDLIENYAKNRKRSIIKIYIPVFIFDLLSRYLSKWGFPISNDQLKMLLQGNLCKENSVWEELDIKPTKIF